jgi:hypothetical protein
MRNGAVWLVAAISLGAIVGFVALYGTSAFVSSRRVRKAVGLALVVLIAAIGAPSIWGACLEYGLRVANGPQGILVAAIPSALLVGVLAIVVGYPRVIAVAACVGQGLASSFLMYWVGMSLDGHSELAAHFSALPFFIPVVLYATSTLAGALIGQGWAKRQRDG